MGNASRLTKYVTPPGLHGLFAEHVAVVDSEGFQRVRIEKNGFLFPLRRTNRSRRSRSPVSGWRSGAQELLYAHNHRQRRPYRAALRVLCPRFRRKRSGRLDAAPGCGCCRSRMGTPAEIIGELRMDINEIRAKYWRLRSLIQQQGAVTPTLDREIALTQLEVLTEIAAQLAEANAVLARIGVVNFEQLALQVGEFFREIEDIDKGLPQ